MLIRITILALCILSTPTFGDGPEKRHVVGALPGAAFFTSGDNDVSFNFGSRIGFGVFRDNSGLLTLGLHTQGIWEKETVGTVDVRSRIFVMSLEIIGRELFGTGLYLGGRFGPAFSRVKIDTVSGSGVAFGVGPALGYEFRFGDAPLGLCLDFSWLSVTSHDISFSGVPVTVEASSAIVLSGGLQFHF
tara:strand:- start:10575 stop:11141 length:567 start_codon:yes stop_codon:yes gene_type:complete